MSAVDLYAVLEVHREASQDVIRAAYKSLSAKYHPDREATPASAKKFAAVQRAFEVLSDPVRRRRYDLDPDGFNELKSEATAVLRVDGSSTFLTLAEHMRRHWQESERCDLSHQDFSGVSFRNARLAGAKLDGSRFIGCDFRGADLTNCSARRCQFDGVDFAGAKVVGTDCSASSLRGAKFFAIGPVWKSTQVSEEHRFTHRDGLQTLVQTTTAEEAVTVVGNTNFTDADLSKSRFAAISKITERTDNTKSNFGTQQTVRFWLKQSIRGCFVEKCNFTGAVLIGCNVSGLSMKDSLLRSTNLAQADMVKCDLSGVDLSTTNLLDANLTNCTYSDTTRWPDGFPMPVGSQNADQQHREKVAKEAKDAKANRKIFAITMFIGILILSAIGLLVYVTTPDPPSFHPRPSSGVITDGVFSAWQIPEGEWVPRESQRNLVLEIQSYARTADLPSGDLTLEVSAHPANNWESKAFVEKLGFVVVGNLGRDNDFFVFPKGVDDIYLSVPVRVHNGRSQLRLSWPKKEEKTWNVAYVTLRIASKTLGSSGKLFVPLR